MNGRQDDKSDVFCFSTFELTCPATMPGLVQNMLTLIMSSLFCLFNPSRLVSRTEKRFRFNHRLPPI